MNRDQALLLAKDVQATQSKLAMEAVRARLGVEAITSGDYKECLEVRKKGKEHWLVWHPKGEERGRGEALAVFTQPRTRVENYRIVCEWHWVELATGRN